MDKLKDISSDELATIRIALLDKINLINTYIKTAQECNQPSLLNISKELLDKHTTLLDKLY